MGAKEGGKREFVVELDSMIEFASKGIVSKTFLDTPDANVGIFCMEKGQSLSEHTSRMPATIQILRGRAKIRLGEEDNEYGPGAWIYIPDRLNHALMALEDFVFLLTLFPRGKK
ncbi:MAG: cupin domain-containing protein [Methanomassiliicoccales archaeon]|nr:cupin domain-containing protein [Methanomassiliicoccales archaeon]